jgi:glycosyltransferase involved in cell wall biosynthesis
MKNQPFFSVVIPVYNRTTILLKTLASILKQSYRDFEIIVVDDGSTEDVEANLSEVIKKNPEVKLIRQENKERGAARNTGLRNASGNYIVFFDSDDLMHEDHLQVLHDNIVNVDYPNFIATKFDFVNENGKQYSSDMCRLKQGYYDYRLFLSGNPLACNICVKKDNPELCMFEEDRKYSIKEDWMFMLENLQKQKLFIIDKVTITMFDHQQRSMRSNNSKIIRRTQLAYEWIIRKVKLTQSEKKILQAHVSYFSGIHSYLDNKRKESINFSMKAIRNGGLKLKYVSLLLKSVIGRELIGKLK